MKKITSFAGLCAYVVGVIGGIGYACYSHAWFIAACVGVLGVLAFPKAKEFVEELLKP